MLRKSFRPFIFENYDIIKILHTIQIKRETPELRFDVIIPPTTEICYNYNFIVLGISFWSILLFISLSRNKKYLYI